MRSYQFAVYMLALRDGTFSDGKNMVLHLILLLGII